MVTLADINMARSHTWALDLRMASEAEVQIALDQQLGIDAAMRVMADRATFPQRRVLKDKRPGLLAVALGAGFIPACHRQAARRFEDVVAMRIMALRAVHLLLQHRVVLG